jgi:putative endonuclease
MHTKQYFVYILSSITKTLYIGVTSDLKKRVWQHKEEFVDGFTKRYRIKKLVYFEMTEDVLSAIAREKQIKRWRREKKVALIESVNPQWRDLYDEI